MGSCTIILTVHALTQWNVENRIQGHIDTPLNDTGHRMAKLLSKRIEKEPLTAIYSSDLRRAIETAKPISEIKGIKIQLDNRLREKRDKSVVNNSEYPLLPYPFDDEDWNHVEQRMFQVMEHIASSNTGIVLVVSHAGSTTGFIQQLISQNSDSREYQRKRTAINKLEWKDGKWSILTLNDVDHLVGLDHTNQNANAG